MRRQMDEYELRQVAVEEGIALPQDDSTNGYIRALVVKSKLDERDKRDRRKFWLKMTAYLVPIFSVGGIGYAKLAPEKPKAATTQDVTKAAKRIERSAVVENKKQIAINRAQIEKLAQFVVNLQETQVSSVDYIVSAMKARRDEEVKKPQPLLDAADAIKDRKNKAEAGKLLQLSDDEIAEISQQVENDLTEWNDE